MKKSKGRGNRDRAKKRLMNRYTAAVVEGFRCLEALATPARLESTRRAADSRRARITAKKVEREEAAKKTDEAKQAA